MSGQSRYGHCQLLDGSRYRECQNHCPLIKHCIVMSEVEAPNLQSLLKVGAHFGHRTRYWNPKMEPYIFGAYNKIHIINLDRTVVALREAMGFVRTLAKHGNKLLFVGTKRATSDVINEQATRCGMPYVERRWLGGMLTNHKTLRSSIKRLLDLEEQHRDGSFQNLKKKEVVRLMRQIDKLNRNLGGLKEMSSLPDALFVIDVDHEGIAVLEAARLRIPIIGIVDTNSDPSKIDYPIPANDDSIRAIRLYASAIADAYIAGRKAAEAVHAGEFQEVTTSNS